MRLNCLRVHWVNASWVNWVDSVMMRRTIQHCISMAHEPGRFDNRRHNSSNRRFRSSQARASLLTSTWPNNVWRTYILIKDDVLVQFPYNSSIICTLVPFSWPHLSKFRNNIQPAGECVAKVFTGNGPLQLNRFSATSSHHSLFNRTSSRSVRVHVPFRIVEHAHLDTFEKQI